jgi:hypothetical protein
MESRNSTTIADPWENIMNRLLKALVWSFVFALGAGHVASAAGQPDPAIGSWVLNLDKSKFHGDTAPKSMTRTYSAGVAGTDMKVTGVAADRTAISQSVTLTYRRRPSGPSPRLRGTP